MNKAVSDWTDRHVLITGGAGYIGSRLVQVLLDRGAWVTVIDALLHGGEGLLGAFPNPRFTFCLGDVTEPGVIRNAVSLAKEKGATDALDVVHLAALVGYPACKIAGRERAWEVNVQGTKLAFEAAEALNAQRFLLASTYSVYGISEDGQPVDEASTLHPQSVYAETKIAAEDLLRQADSSMHCAPVIFRFATLYGPSPRIRFDLIINQFVLEAFSRSKLVIFQRGYSRSFVHIEDVLQGILCALCAAPEDLRGQTFNLGAEEGNYTKEDIVEFIRRALPDTQIEYQDLAFDGDMRDMRVSYDRIREQLGFQARHTVPEGISQVLALLRSGLITEPDAARYRNAPAILRNL